MLQCIDDNFPAAALQCGAVSQTVTDVCAAD